MGPPTAALKSYTWYVGLKDEAPRACNSGVKLFDCMPFEKPEAATRPDSLLPPCLGTMFI